jgi:hypothetical protein
VETAASLLIAWRDRANADGELITFYCRKDGTPMKSEKKRLNGGKVLFHEVITGVKYSVARQRPLRDSKLTNESVAANGKEKAKKATK